MDVSKLFGKGYLKSSFKPACELFDMNTEKAQATLKAALMEGMKFEGSVSYANAAEKTCITKDGALGAKAKLSFDHSSGLGVVAEGDFPSKGTLSASFKNLAPGLKLSASVEAKVTEAAAAASSSAASSSASSSDEKKEKKDEKKEKKSSDSVAMTLSGSVDYCKDPIKAQATVKSPMGGSIGVEASVAASFEGVTVAADAEYTVGQTAPNAYNVGIAYTQDKLFVGAATSNKLGVITGILQSKVVDKVNAAVAVSYTVGEKSLPPMAVSGEYDLEASGKIRATIASSGDVAVAYSLKIQDAVQASVGSHVNFKTQKFGFGVSASYDL